MKKYFVLAMLIILSSVVYAHGESHDDFSEALRIIENQVPCKDLTDDDFELLGDYYMELMHPGQEHVRMDSMMGLPGSESLRIMHINMGRAFYCDNDIMSGMGMMSNSNYQNRGMLFTTMMANLNWLNFIFNSVLYFALIIAIILAVIWLYKNIVDKKDPIGILKQRLTKGEITKKEYNELKKELR